MRSFFAGIFCAVLAGTGWSLFSFLKPEQKEITLEDIGYDEADTPKSLDSISYLSYQNDKEEVKFLPLKKPYLIHFWATWCPPCVKEFPNYAKFANNHGNALTFTSDHVVDVKAFYKKKGISLHPIHLDVDKKIMKAFDVHSLPSTLIVGKNGKTKYITGMIKWQDPRVVKAIEKALSEFSE